MNPEKGQSIAGGTGWVRLMCRGGLRPPLTGQWGSGDLEGRRWQLVRGMGVSPHMMLAGFQIGFHSR